MYGNPSPKFSIMEIMEIYVVLLCACTIAAIFVERGQATNVYPPREFSDNERDLTMMLTSCILYNKLLILLSITKTPIFQTLAIIACRKKNHIRHTHIFLSSPQTFIIKLHTYPSWYIENFFDEIFIWSMDGQKPGVVPPLILPRHELTRNGRMGANYRHSPV